MPNINTPPKNKAKQIKNIILIKKEHFMNKF